MQAKTINKDEFKSAIRIAFRNDNKIKDFYDGTVKIESVDDIVNDISSKINCFDEPTIKGVFEKDKLIGYYVYLDKIKMLSSFSINNQYRVRNKLRSFFALIKKDLGKEWAVLLWSKNLRAIKWLQKNDLKIIDQNALITTLRYN